MGDHYIGANLLQPRKNEIVRGHVVALSSDVSGNIMVRVHANPILNTRMYQVYLQEVRLQN